MGQITANGKPMCVLRALHGTTAENPMTEYDVYRDCQRQAGRQPQNWTQVSYHSALRSLVERGLAEKCGARGLGQWFITDAGRDLIWSFDSSR